MPLVDAEGAAALRNYKYSGADNSLVLRFVLRHYFDLLHRTFFPAWLAPNVITLIGFGFICAAHAALAVAAPTLTEAVPGWLAVSSGVAVHLYSTFDNIDGRQARATGSSSPLGHLLDHGCDALSVVVTGLNLASVMRLSSWLTIFTIWSGAMTQFYFATWEEYHTGTLILPYINGPIEGILLIIGCNFMTAALGSHIWLLPVSTVAPAQVAALLPARVLGWQLNQAMSAFGFFLAICVSVRSIIETHLSALRHGRSLVWTSFTIAPFVLFSASLQVLAGGSVAQTHTRVFVWVFGLVFSDMMSRVILAHLTHKEFPLLTPPLAAVGVVAVLSASGQEWASERAEVYIGLLCALAVYSMVFAVRLVREFTTILKIRAFVLPRKVPPKKQA